MQTITLYNVFFLRKFIVFKIVFNSPEMHIYFKMVRYYFRLCGEFSLRLSSFFLGSLYWSE